MKKERIVAICICAVLLGSLYAQGIAWTCHFAMPSMAQLVWPFPFGMQFGKVEEPRKTSAFSDTIAAFVCSGWPPIGLLYGEARLLEQGSKDMQALRARHRQRGTPEVQNRLQGATKGPLPAALQMK